MLHTFQLQIFKKNYSANISVVTQNIDTLHEQAGNENVYHIHGQFDQYICLRCHKVFHNLDNITPQTPCPFCHKERGLKPNIVFFGENLLYMDEVEELLNSCDLFISIGTSGTVFPAASFVQIAKKYGADTYEFTLEETSNNFYFDQHIYGKAGETLPEFVAKLIKKA
ncbi:MAG: Sir2 family NAD-dependent protein deacetylase [Alphaproteobacteria bacterium]